jgi:hypothetical protein
MQINGPMGDDDRDISAWSGDASRASVIVATPRWRARPDGHQRWLRLPLDPTSAAQLRLRATEAGVTVDAWLGIALAYEQVQAELPDRDLSRRLRSALSSRPLRFASTDKLRGWQRYLLQADSPGLRDELPEVVLGAGISISVVARALPAALRLGSGDWQLGCECELRAAADMTLLPEYIRALAAA